MTWGTTQRGFDTLPLGSVQVPGSAPPIPWQGSPLTFSDANGNSSAPGVTADQIVAAVWSGRVYVATTTIFATATNTGLVMGAALFNNSTVKNMYIFGLLWSATAIATSVKYNIITANPTYATSITPSNMYASNVVASLATVTCAANGATASITPTGTTQDVAFVPAATTYDFFSTHPGVLLPAGVAFGVSIFGTVAVAGQSWAATFRYVEF